MRASRFSHSTASKGWTPASALLEGALAAVPVARAPVPPSARVEGMAPRLREEAPDREPAVGGRGGRCGGRAAVLHGGLFLFALRTSRRAGGRCAGLLV